MFRKRLAAGGTRGPWGLPERGPLAGRWERLETGDRAARVRAARWIAFAADAVQIVLMPLFGEGALSPANDLLDVVVAFLLVRLIGWHVSFLPTFVAEFVPGLDLVPTWSVAVWLATRGAAQPAAPGSPGTRTRSSAEVIEP